MPLKTKATLLRICGISLLAMPAQAQEHPDSTAQDMRTVVVTSKVATTSVGLYPDGTMAWDADAFQLLPHILGNADPVHYAQMLPGVQTGSEMDAGLHIQGSDNAHNLTAIQGVPIYNAAHLLGLFSVFNASHYSHMKLKKGANTAADPSRLGGTLTMDLPQEPADSVGGEASLGLISSQGTVRLPTGRSSALTLSARGSYLNLLYSRWLEMDGLALHYNFYDLNATWQWRLNSHHRLWVDGYWGQDRANFRQDEYQAKVGLRWGNHLAAVHWRYDSDALSASSTLYHTRYANRLQLSQADMRFGLPSSICDLGWRGSVHWHGLRVGAESVWHQLQPQEPEAENVYNQSFTPQPRQHTQEYSVYADYPWAVTPSLQFTPGVRATAYVDPSRHIHTKADPSLFVSYTRDRWQLSASYALRHQFLFQTGTTSLGMPTEFWNSVGSGSPVQWGHNASVAASLYLADGRWRLSADLYYKRLYHQVEYDGDMMKFLNTSYQLEDNLLHGNGYNYGFSVMIAKRTGRLTGWASYAFGRARRRFPDYDAVQQFSASHERPHEVNVLLTWQINARLSVAGTYVFASGTPFTAPENFYVMNGMLLTQYGPHNGRRLRPYNRLDLSVNYLLPTRRFKQSGLNLSLYNATMQQNDIACRLKIHDGGYLYSHFTLINFVLPSVSYFLKF